MVSDNTTTSTEVYCIHVCLQLLHLLEQTPHPLSGRPRINATFNNCQGHCNDSTTLQRHNTKDWEWPLPWQKRRGYSTPHLKVIGHTMCNSLHRLWPISLAQPDCHFVPALPKQRSGYARLVANDLSNLLWSPHCLVHMVTTHNDDKTEHFVHLARHARTI